MFETTTKELIRFIQDSPTCYHAIAAISKQLLSHGFVRLDETTPWQLEKGGKYYVIRSDSSVIAFKIPEAEMKIFQIIASHSDSPSFKIK